MPTTKVCEHGRPEGACGACFLINFADELTSEERAELASPNIKRRLSRARKSR